MKIPVLAATLLAAMAAAQPGAHTPILQDEEGKNLIVTGWKHWGVKRLPNGRLQLNLKADPGQTVVAQWVQENMRLEANQLEMIATKDYKLVTAQLTGAIEVASKKGPAATRQSLQVNAPSASYVAADRTITVPGRISLVTDDAGTGQHVEASGTSGKVTLSDGSKKDELMEEARLAGPIKFEMRGKRLEDDKPVTYLVKGGGDNMVYADGSRKLTFTGHVSLKGDDPFLAGEISGVEQAIIFLNARREIESIEMTGSPGKTTIEQKPGKGGGGGGRRRR